MSSKIELTSFKSNIETKEDGKDQNQSEEDSTRFKR